LGGYPPPMARKRQTAAEYIEGNALLVPVILGDMAEHLGHAAQEWSLAVWAARDGKPEMAVKHIVEVAIAVDIPLKVGRSELRAITERAANRLDAELPDEEDTTVGAGPGADGLSRGERRAALVALVEEELAAHVGIGRLGQVSPTESEVQASARLLADVIDLKFRLEPRS
jgi:hypothetical protein